MPVEKVTELNLSRATLPCVANNSGRWKFAHDFMIRVICHVEKWGSRDTILSKRRAGYKGKKIGLLLTDPGPGLMLQFHKTRVELLTFGANDIKWHCLASKPKSIMPGERYEILAGRKQRQGFIYINEYPSIDIANNISSDQPGMIGGISQGDINCDEPCYIGVAHFNGPNFWMLDGCIEYLGIFNNYQLPRAGMRYRPRKTWMTQNEFLDRIPPNTRRVFSMQDLGFRVKE